jgi:hypothetical protein
VPLVQKSVRGEDVTAPRAEGCPVHIGHAPAGFGDNQCPAGDVPRLQIALPEAVHTPGRDVTQIDRCRSQASHGSRLADEGAKQTDNLVDASVHVVGKAGDHHGVDE